MPVARGSQNAGHMYSNITMPYILNLSFVVNPENGLGVTSVKSNGYVERVFMHTSTTPTAVNGVTNPNPASGYAFIQFKQNWNIYLLASASIIAPTTGGALTSVVTNTTYVINALGTTTTAQWVTAGLPAGFTPAVGQAFVAKATAAIGGTGSVKLPSASGISVVELIGDPNQSIANTSIARNSGAYVMLEFLSATSASVTSLIPAAPAALSVVNLAFMYDRSSVTIDGL